jgi:FkbM family methyltransferase
MFKATIKGDLSIDVPDALARIYTDFEPCTLQVISDGVCPGDVFLDIGANFGFFSVLASSIVGPEGRVYAVEASPTVLPILADNTRDLSNVTIIHSAAGDRVGTTDFYMTEDFVNSGIALSPFTDRARKISVPIDTLDSLLGRQPLFDGRVSFIKCDVQGDEIAVLRGLRETIRRADRLKLIVEWAPAWMNNAGFDAKAVPEVLKSLGFRELLVVDDYLRKTMSVAEMEEEFHRDQSGKRFCNLLATK